ncbi:hypothetical protein [Flavobacterium urocaniciphilum]|uniref:Uncharacterized protein n=1 Tax=Flavobacterium urocaniciphilum TaxID=1299341 RepID=A0A1H8ZPX5_9FLAO|nr:hypothetical protein [Flavobacterium urocaniciphilum]SEP66462.1 hypothetical protein SAMN05444005_101833 [Flavobacterium urocaniciphilum]
MVDQKITLSFINYFDFELISILKKNFPLFQFSQCESSQLLIDLKKKKITSTGYIFNYQAKEFDEIISELNKNMIPFILIINKPADAIYGFKNNAIYCTESPLSLEKTSFILLKLQFFFYKNSMINP